MREAEDQFRLLINYYADRGRVPPVDGIEIRYAEYREELIFFTRLANRRAFQWYVPREWAMDFRSPQELVGELRRLWDRLRAERCEPPRMIAPPSNEELRREMMRPEPPRMIAPPSNEELRREMMRPDGIIEYRHGFSPALAEMQRRQRELEREVFYGGPRQPRMQAPCPCPACRPSDGDAKSLALLKQWLSPSQLAQYERDRFFDVTGSTSGKRYRIRTDRQQNVYRLEGGREMHGLCFVPDPEQTRAVGDVMLAQKIALETDEAEALKVAQAFPVFGAQSLF